MAYGYLGQNTPNQTVNNSGVFSITDSADLESQGALGGSLELIQEQTVTGNPTAVSFTNIKESIYDVHLLEFNNLKAPSQAQDFGFRFSTNSGSSYVTSGYQYAYQYVNTAGGAVETRSTSATHIQYSSTGGDSRNNNGYAYFYNLGNSAKYSFSNHQLFQDGAGTDLISFGGGVYPTANTVNGLQILTLGSSGYTAGVVKLFGVKQIWVT